MNHIRTAQFDGKDTPKEVVTKLNQLLKDFSIRFVVHGETLNGSVFVQLETDKDEKE